MSQSTLVSQRDGMMLSVLGIAKRDSLSGIAQKRRCQKPMRKTVGTNTTTPANSAGGLARLLVVILASVTLWAQAEDAPQAEAGPAHVITEVTERVMRVVAEADAYFDEDPDRYYREIDSALAVVVDWRGFATAVMGEYYSRGRSMDSDGRANLKRQRDEFAQTLREGLIRSYAKGLLAFGGAEMVVKGVEASPQSARIASVTQLVYGEADRVYTIRYQMGQYKDGSWRLRNLIIETINLGEIYRNQFVALAKDANEDLDQVIAQWNETISEQAEELARD
ncbi:MAG: ABC transporter substrate-binding protein [Halieaceae bacterium]